MLISRKQGETPDSDRRWRPVAVGHQVNDRKWVNNRTPVSLFGYIRHRHTHITSRPWNWCLGPNFNSEMTTNPEDQICLACIQGGCANLLLTLQNLPVWNHWENIHTNQQCVCIDIDIQVFSSNWLTSGFPWRMLNSMDCSSVPSESTTKVWNDYYEQKLPKICTNTSTAIL